MMSNTSCHYYEISIFVARKGDHFETVLTECNGKATEKVELGSLTRKREHQEKNDFLCGLFLVVLFL